MGEHPTYPAGLSSRAYLCPSGISVDLCLSFEDAVRIVSRMEDSTYADDWRPLIDQIGAVLERMRPPSAKPVPEVTVTQDGDTIRISLRGDVLERVWGGDKDALRQAAETLVGTAMGKEPTVKEGVWCRCAMSSWPHRHESRCGPNGVVSEGLVFAGRPDVQ